MFGSLPPPVLAWHVPVNIVSQTKPHQFVVNQAGVDAEAFDILLTIIRRGVGVHDGDPAEGGAEQVHQFFASVALEWHVLGGVTGAG